MEKRRAAFAETRRRILEAARRSLSHGENTDLGLDAIARTAGVSRLTVYNHFRSRAGVLEALYDYLAMRGRVHRAMEALRAQAPADALAAFVHALVHFWSSDPVVIRRLHAMAALDAEIARGLRARERRRRRAAVEIVLRMVPAGVRTRGATKVGLLSDTISALVSFETYDALARARHGRDEIIAVLTRLVRAGLPPTARRREPHRNPPPASRRPSAPTTQPSRPTGKR